jgi:hypothetical protein
VGKVPAGEVLPVVADELVAVRFESVGRDLLGYFVEFYAVFDVYEREQAFLASLKLI